MKNERGGNEKPTWSAGVAGGEGLGITLALENSLLFLSVFYLLSLLASSVMCSLILLPRVCYFSLSSLSSLVLMLFSVSLRRNRGIIVLLFGLVLLGYSLVLSVCLFPRLSSFSNGFFFGFSPLVFSAHSSSVSWVFFRHVFFVVPLFYRVRSVVTDGMQRDENIKASITEVSGLLLLETVSG